MRNLLVYSIFFLILGETMVFAKDAAEKPPRSQPKNMNLSIEKAVDLVLHNNLTLRSAKYDVIMSDTQVKKNQKQYAPVLELGGSYLWQKSPLNASNRIGGGQEFYQWEVNAALSKMYSSGTTISVGVDQIISDSNDQPLLFGTQVIPALPQFMTPSIYVGIQQELLKNAFGYTQRRNEMVLLKNAQIQRESLVNTLSVLVVNALVDYWQVTINKRAVVNAQDQLKATRNVRDIVSRNIRLGLSERFDLNQYNSLVALGEAKEALAEQNLKESIRKLLRTINVPADTKISGVTNLIETRPLLVEKEALETAYKKRADYRNAVLSVEAAKLEVELHENNALPSLTAGVRVQSNGQDTNFFTAQTDLPKLTYPQWQASIKMTYPLWDEELKTNVRNAHLRLRQAKLKLEDMRQEVEFDVKNHLEQVKLQHNVLLRNKEASQEADKYYALLLRRSRQGKFNAATVKSALDNRIEARQRELESLVAYNIALLRFELAKNEIFEKYNVDVEKLLREVQ